jgi:hypothetical protein
MPNTSKKSKNGGVANSIATRLGYALVAAALVLIGTWGFANATSTFITQQGGTGTTSPSGILYGDNGATSHLNTVTIGSNLTFSGGTLSATGGGSTGLATSSPIASSNLLVYSATGAGSAFGVGTSTLTASAPLTGSFTQIGSGGTLGCQTASGSQAGCLSSTDWTTFNNKVATTRLINTTYPLQGGGDLSTDRTLSLGTVGTANGGTGTTTWQTGSVPYFNGTRFTEDHSHFYYDGTNHYLGIGTTSPQSQLEVDGVLTIQGPPPAGNANFILQSGDYVGKWSVLTNGISGDFAIYDYLDNKTPFDIAKNAPTNSLTVSSSGDVNVGVNLQTTGCNTLSRSGQNLVVNNTSSCGSGEIDFYTNSTQKLVLTNGGYLGVGTTTPQYQLTVASSTAAQLSLSAGAGVVQQTFRAESDGSLDIATTTTAGTATSTVTNFKIDKNGKLNVLDVNNQWKGVVGPTRSFALTTGTTTAWTASTTSSGYSPFIIMPFTGTLRDVRCALDQSFLGVNVQVNGSNATPSYFVASSTVGTVAFTAGNTFTAGQKVLANFGTTTTASTLGASCTFDATETP